MDEKMSLFDIDEQILKLISLEESDLVDAETGEVLIDICEELDKLDMQRNEKIVHIGRYIDSLSRESELLKEKAKQLTERAKSKDVKIERLEEYVKESMLKFGTKKIEDETVTVRLNSTKIVQVNDETLIPEEYMVTKVEVKPDKRRILAELKSGKQIAGVELGESNSITVR